MAEGIERAMCAMAEEFTEMTETKLMSESQVKTIREKRSRFEHKLRNIPRSKEDYKNYLNFEIDLLTLIKFRKEKMHIRQKLTLVEHKILSRCKRLYEEMLRHFANDYDTNVEYFNFCKKMSLINPATAAIDSLIEHHSGNENSWHLAAKWHMEGRHNYKVSVEYYVKGLALHKSSKLLYKEAINLELSQAKHSGEDKRSIACEKVKDYLTTLFANMDDFSFYLKLLALFDEHSFTKELSEIMLQKLKASYLSEPSVWHALAQRELKGMVVGRNANGDLLQKACISRYLEGLQKIKDRQKKSELWCNFLDHIMQMYSMRRCDLDFVINYMEAADTSQCLTEPYYFNWLELGGDENALQILEKGIKAHPNSVRMWKLLYNYHVLQKSPELIISNTFENGILALKEKALPLWMAHIRYNMMLNHEDTLNLFQRAVVAEQPEEISSVMKPQYLEWLISAKTIEETRIAYEALANQRPYCKELHVAMVNIEQVQKEIDKVETIWKLACTQFPEDLDVWVNTMEFLHHNKPKKLLTQYYRAIASLKDLELSHFKEKYRHVIDNCQ